MSRAARSLPLDLLVRVREAEASLPPAETARVALTCLGEVAAASGQWGQLLLKLGGVLESAIFSKEDSTSTTGTAAVDHMSYLTIAQRAREQAEWSRLDCTRLRAENLALRSRNELAAAEAASAREELRAELERQSNAQLRIEHLTEQLRLRERRAKAVEAEARQSFLALTGEAEALRHKLTRSSIVMGELSSFRDRLESVRVRFRALTADRLSDTPHVPTPPQQVVDLTGQLRGLYYDLVDTFEAQRTNLLHTREHHENVRAKFARDAGSLIREKERLGMHAIRELGVAGGGNPSAPNEVLAQLVRLRLRGGGMWNGYANLCSYLLSKTLTHASAGGNDGGGGGAAAAAAAAAADAADDPPSELVSVDPPSWAHPLPTPELVHQEIIVVFTSARKASGSIVVCTESAGMATGVPLHAGNARPVSRPTSATLHSSAPASSSHAFVSFSDHLVGHYLEQYGDRRIALAALHSFLKAVARLRAQGSQRVELFALALSGKISIFACWAFAEAVRALAGIRDQIRLETRVERETATLLLYGDFATHAEMAEVAARLHAHCTDADVAPLGVAASPYSLLLEFVAGQIVGGVEARLRRALTQLAARDLVNAGCMRLTRFQDAVVGILKPKKASRRAMTRLFRAVAYETHAKSLLGQVASGKVPDSAANEGKVGGGGEGGEGLTTDDGRFEAVPAAQTANAQREDAMKRMMMMPVDIDNKLAGVLAFYYWTTVPSADVGMLADARAVASGENLGTLEEEKDAEEKEGEDDVFDSEVGRRSSNAVSHQPAVAAEEEQQEPQEQQQELQLRAAE